VTDQPPKSTTPKPTAKEAREAALAKALRDNLKRRKAAVPVKKDGA